MLTYQISSFICHLPMEICLEEYTAKETNLEKSLWVENKYIIFQAVYESKNIAVLYLPNFEWPSELYRGHTYFDLSLLWFNETDLFLQVACNVLCRIHTDTLGNNRFNHWLSMKKCHTRSTVQYRILILDAPATAYNMRIYLMVTWYNFC